jgi:hypothetical protein
MTGYVHLPHHSTMFLLEFSNFFDAVFDLRFGILFPIGINQSLRVCTEERKGDQLVVREKLRLAWINAITRQMVRVPIN